jgi:hypothetical protein
MTKEQAAQLGRALIAWSENREAKVRTTSGPDQSWYPFAPHSYEKLNVENGLEWATAECASIRNGAIHADANRETLALNNSVILSEANAQHSRSRRT